MPTTISMTIVVRDTVGERAEGSNPRAPQMLRAERRAERDPSGRSTTRAAPSAIGCWADARARRRPRRASCSGRATSCRNGTLPPNSLKRFTRSSTRSGRRPPTTAPPMTRVWQSRSTTRLVRTMLTIRKKRRRKLARNVSSLMTSALTPLTRPGFQITEPSSGGDQGDRRLEAAPAEATFGSASREATSIRRPERHERRYGSSSKGSSTGIV